MAKKVAVVTGAGSGIGKAVTLALLDAAYDVVLVGRRQSALEQVAAEANVSGSVLIAPCDIRDPLAVEKLFGTVAEKFGRLDFLFNNAGTGTRGPLEDIRFDDWQRVVDTNLTGAFLCTQHAFRLMKSQTPQGGRIINNGSISAHAPRPDSVPYTATKHAITGLTKATSLDGRKYNIACGQIDIGNALTDNTAILAQGVPQANGTIVGEPLMDVQEVARAVLHMANLPLATNVLFMTIMPTNMPFIGRG